VICWVSEAICSSVRFARSGGRSERGVAMAVEVCEGRASEAVDAAFAGTSSWDIVVGGRERVEDQPSLGSRKRGAKIEGPSKFVQI
jgi:hypothetical protein